jgi:hypothetical protein
MTTAEINIPPSLKRVVSLVLIAGFGSAIAIYVAAAIHPESSKVYEPEDSKRYVREMELYGGKANVLASDFRQWFESLWHGRNLAFTVAVLTILLALGVLFFALPLPPVSPPSHGNRGQPDGTAD